jgi:hypothetical protein
MNGPLNKTNLVLLGAFAVQLALLLFLRAGGGDEATTPGKVDHVAGTKPFSTLELKDVAAIACKKREGQGVRLEKETTKDGAGEKTNWYLADRDRFPAKATEAEKLLESLKKLSLSRVITRQPKRYAGLNVAEGASDLKVSVYGADGKALAEVFLGEGRDYNQIHVRKAGDDAVYAATGAAVYDFPAEASALAETKFMELDAAKIVGFKVKNESGEYEAVKETPVSRPTSRPESEPASRPESGPESAPAPAPKPYWITKGDAPQKLDEGKVDSWLRGLATASLAEPVGKERKPEYGFDKPAAVVTIRTDDGKETTITVGAERKDQYDWYVAATGKDHVVTVKSYNVTDWFKKALKDLLPGETHATPEDG